MYTTARNYDIICLQLRNHYSQLDNPLQKDTANLLNIIRSSVTSEKYIKQSIDKSLSIIFNLRVKAIKWLFESNSLGISDLIGEAIPHFEELKEKSKYEILAENILFALRCNKRVVTALLKSGEFSEENFSTPVPKLPVITYTQFITSIALGIPDDKVVQKIVDWTNASLYIEYISLAAIIINDENLKVSNKVLKDLAFLIADAAQNYFACATELGILQPTSMNQSINQNIFDKKFISKQKLFAECGIENYFSKI